MTLCLLVILILLLMIVPQSGGGSAASRRLGQARVTARLAQGELIDLASR
jgi:hypothetical protein